MEIGTVHSKPFTLPNDLATPWPIQSTGKHMLKSQAIPMIGALRRLEPILVGDHVDFNQSQIMGTQSPPAFCRLVTCICMCSATRKSLPFSWLWWGVGGALKNWDIHRSIRDWYFRSYGVQELIFAASWAGPLIRSRNVSEPKVRQSCCFLGLSSAVSPNRQSSSFDFPNVL